MDQISKLFGKKSPADEPGEDALGSSKQDLNAQNLDPSEPFGLKFTLNTGEAHLFSSLPITIGRSPENNLVIDNDTVSMAHALVYFDEAVQDVCIVDQDSLNGLFIDGLPTRKNILHDGVQITLGEATLNFRDTGYIHV